MAGRGPTRAAGSLARSRATLAGAALALACGGDVAPPPAPSIGSAAPAERPERVTAAIAGRVFDLEVALDDAARQRGLGGRTALGAQAGMLFVWRRPLPLAMVMRDCPIPLDVAFFDATGRVLAVHPMRPEPPRRPGERAAAYEARLPAYASPAPAALAMEVAGGSLTELGVAPGDLVVIEGLSALMARAR